MRLYGATADRFIADTRQNRMPELLERAFHSHYHRDPPPGEVAAWTNSLQFMKNVIEETGVLDTYVVVEQEMPYSNMRIDVILFGRDAGNHDHAVVTELKQWSRVEPCDVEGNVLVQYGGKPVHSAHPCLQVQQYHHYLTDFYAVFDGPNPIRLSSCVYCHNLKAENCRPMLQAAFREIISRHPLFTAEEFRTLAGFLRDRIRGGQGLAVFHRFDHSTIRPSRRLIDHARDVIGRQPVFHLLEEQLTANNVIVDRVRKAAAGRGKTVILVRGGPGTGKSVVALNAMAEVLALGKKVFHASGAAAFKKTLERALGSRLASLIKFTDGFYAFKENEADVIICDEAHRIREETNAYYVPVQKRTGLPQVDELVRAARVSVFFVDENQIVSPQEVGDPARIREAAQRWNAELFGFELTTQFRCNGSVTFIDWVDGVLGLRDLQAFVLPSNSRMTVRLVDSPHELSRICGERNTREPNSCRIVAGWCWPWTKTLTADGRLPRDVKIGDFEMPWETHRDIGGRPEGFPPKEYWAFDPSGAGQVGTIYTVQGFEFRTICVILGPDLRFDLNHEQWVADPTKSHDPRMRRLSSQQYLPYAKRIYRTLLTRAMSECVIYCMDPGARAWIQRWIGPA